MVILHRGRVIAAFAVMALAAALAACGPSHSTVSPSAKASVKSAASAIAKGQAAKQAKRIVRDCLHKGGTVMVIVRCVAPPGHRLAFGKCAEQAVAADIPGQENRFYTVDLENCMVRFR